MTAQTALFTLPEDQPEPGYLPAPPLSQRIAEAAAGCSAGELLAGLIGGRQAAAHAAALLDHFVSLRNLGQASVVELASIGQLSSAAAVRLKAALELSIRLTTEFDGQRFQPTINSPRDIFERVVDMSYLQQEHLRVLVLDTRNRVLAMPTIYIGSLNMAVVRVAELLRPAIRLNAAAIAMAHNHPSGDPNPSPEDVGLTRCVWTAGKQMDIELIDHLIVGGLHYVSLKERGLGFA
jgi:DNA repair protein RadC